MKHFLLLCFVTVSFVSYSSENYSQTVAEAYRVAACLKAIKDGQALDPFTCVTIDYRCDFLASMNITKKEQKECLKTLRHVMKKEGLETKFVALVYNDSRKMRYIY